MGSRNKHKKNKKSGDKTTWRNIDGIDEDMIDALASRPSTEAQNGLPPDKDQPDADLQRETEAPAMEAIAAPQQQENMDTSGDNCKSPVRPGTVSKTFTPAQPMKRDRDDFNRRALKYASNTTVIPNQNWNLKLSEMTKTQRKTPLLIKPLYLTNISKIS